MTTITQVAAARQAALLYFPNTIAPATGHTSGLY
jgi:hypothetical protein